ncbi:MAG TPA: hypothetical protein PKD55_19775 [Bellilinea sp.]|nr:hypothetical protein [Bellilinea sp.]
MSPEVGRLWFRIAFFLVLISAGLLFILKPGSAEYVVTVMTLVVGILLILAIKWLINRST